MESAIYDGDRILIDKTAYGVRLPVTILSVPFTCDYYSTAIELPYKRLFESKVKRNDIVLFNNPLDILRPLDKRELLLSRCVGLSGDSVHVKDGVFFINGDEYINSPDMNGVYFIKYTEIEVIQEIIEDLELSIVLSKRQGDSIFLQANKLEVFILNKSLPDSLSIKQLTDSANYSFIIPSKGQIINLNAETLAVYAPIILLEQGDKAKIADDKLYLDNKEQKSYTFQDDYYWMLSDNILNSTDSRSLGFIPFKNIVGKKCFTWYSK